MSINQFINKNSIENLRNNYYYQTKNLEQMEKLTRHRKAFYQKQNDYKNGNQKVELHKSFDGKYINHSLEHYQSVNQRNTHLPIKKASKNDTEAYCQNYSFEILHSLENFTVPPKFLDNHKIDSNLRARMLDWMVEVMTSYKFTHKSYFAGIQIMDRYFLKQKQQLLPTRLHIIGVVSMMIASKMQEIYPLKVKTVFQKIAHKKIPEQELMQLEQRISSALDFKLNSWTCFDLAIAKVYILLQSLTSKRNGPLSNITNNYFSVPHNQKTMITKIQQNLSKIQEVLSYIGKFLIYDYDFYCSGSLSLFSDVLLKLTFEILKIPCQVDSVLTSPQIDVELYKQQLKQKIKKYDQKFKGINNLKKFTNQQVVNLVQKEVIYQ